MATRARQHALLPAMLTVAILLVAAYLRLRLLATVPYGWHPDEATKAVIAWEILLGQRPIAPFYTQFTGREPLYILLEAVFIALIGRSTLAVRAMTAFIGLLTIALTFNLGRRMFNRRVAWLAAGLLSVSLWHVIASRNGYRAVSQPFVQLPAFIFLWRGLKRGKTRDYALAGAFVGLAQYTYSAARFFPVLMLLSGLGALLARRERFREEFPRWAVMGGAALLIFVPLGIYFIQNPADLVTRANQISVFNPEVNGGDALEALLRNLRDAALMFGSRGDANFRFNLSERPIFTPVEMGLFVTGLALAGWRLLRRSGLERLKYGLLWLWLLVMALPMILTVEGIPYFQRTLGIIPAVFFFPALALDWLVGLIEKRVSYRAAWRWAAHTAMAVGLVALGLLVQREYFVKWHGAALGWEHRRLEMTQLAQYIEQTSPDTPPYISTDQGLNPVMLWYAPDYFFDLHWFDASQVMVYPPPGTEVDYVFAAQTTPNPALLQMTDGLQRTGDAKDPFDRVSFSTYRWPADAGPPKPEFTGPLYWSAENFYPELLGDGEARTLQSLSSPVDVGHDVWFLGYNILSESVRPGEPLELALHWRIRNVPDHPYTVFVHLIDAETVTHANGDSNFHPTLFWSEGDTFVGYHVLWTPEDLPPGEYLIQLGMYNPDTGERATVYDADSRPVDARILAGPIIIE